MSSESADASDIIFASNSEVEGDVSAHRVRVEGYGNIVGQDSGIVVEYVREEVY
jgi:hypothetical protein